jgi:diguanylate cyclase (GGDEF)-like protein/PAS domain S-box-containing protein
MTYLPILLLLIPIFFLLYASIELYQRGTDRESRIAAATMFTLFLLFMTDYIQTLVSVEYTYWVNAYLKYPISILSGGMAFLLHISITRAYRIMKWKWAVVVLMLPLVFYGIVLQRYGPSIFFRGIEVGGIWKRELPSDVLLVFLGFMGLIALMNLFLCIWSYRGSSTAFEKKRLRTLVYVHLFYTVGNVICLSLIEMIQQYTTVPSIMTILPTLFWGAAIRLLMNRGNLLPSASKKFEVLYRITPTAIVLLDRSGELREANLNAQRLLGGQLPNLLHKRIDQFIGGDELNLEKKTLIESLVTEPWKNRECSLKTLNGVERTVLIDTDSMKASGERFVLVVIRDITEKKQEELLTQYIAHHDSLTGLANRLMFNQSLDKALIKAEQQGSSMAVMLIDLDRFKMINDTLGHQYGDEALLEMASRLKACIGDEGMAARIGGDEFAVLLPHLDEFDDVIHKAEAILEQFLSPVTLLGRDFYMAASLGISMYPGDGDTAALLLKHADIAMYHAKSNGGNQYRFHSKELNAALRRHVEMEASLRKCLEQGELELYFQPQLDLTSSRLTGAEALLRWNSKELGWVPPTEFIPIAEQTGLIVRIGRWVLEEACREAVRWSASSGLTLTVSVNVSASQLMQPDFVHVVKGALRQSGLPPEQLILEITESMVMNKLQLALRMLDDLVELGISISMDDFGTGYSSLSVIKQLPISSIKIDRSFIMDMTAKQVEHSIVPAIISMSHNLGKAVVAEGVEEAAQLDILRELGCDKAQGYYYSKPLSARDMGLFVQKKRTAV